MRMMQANYVKIALNVGCGKLQWYSSGGFTEGTETSARNKRKNVYKYQLSLQSRIKRCLYDEHFAQVVVELVLTINIEGARLVQTR